MIYKERYCSAEVKKNILIAAFLDPRFKDLDPFVERIDRIDVVQDVKTELVMATGEMDPELSDCVIAVDDRY